MRFMVSPICNPLDRPRNASVGSSNSVAHLEEMLHLGGNAEGALWSLGEGIHCQSILLFLHLLLSLRKLVLSHLRRFGRHRRRPFAEHSLDLRSRQNLFCTGRSKLQALDRVTSGGKQYLQRTEHFQPSAVRVRHGENGVLTNNLMAATGMGHFSRSLRVQSNRART